MSGASIGSGSGQRHILGKGDGGRAVGIGDRPSLPEWARHFNPLDGPARGGTVLPHGPAVKITQVQANFLNKYHGLLPTGPLPPNESEMGAFLGVVEATQTPSFSSWLRGERGRIYLFRALLQAHADHSDLEIGLHDIADAFGSPGPSNMDLIYKLTRWARTYPIVRSVLNGVVEQMRAEGRIPLEVKS